MIRRRATAFAAAAISAVAGCQAVAPALTNLMLAFGQDMLAATAVNYTPRYAIEVENLLAVLARSATGMQFQGQLAQAGYQPPPPGYAQQSGSGYGQSGGYGQQAGYGDYGSNGGYQTSYPTEPAYGQSAAPESYGQPATPETDQDPYAQPGGSYQDPYSQTRPAAGYGYGQASYSESYAPAQGAAYQDPYAIPAGGYQTRSADPGPVSLGVALLVRHAGADGLEAVEDGDTLHDGRGDPSQGDLLRVHFQSNCACWIYVIGIDATGYVAQIFPDPDSAQGNPVTAGVNYLMPGGDSWWGLDEQRGIEQIYVVAARVPRPDIEAAVAQLTAQPRRLTTADYRPVAEPAIIPSTRGLVKVTAPAPVRVPVANAPPAVINPAIFSNSDGATDLVVTRWFRHE